MKRRVAILVLAVLVTPLFGQSSGQRTMTTDDILNMIDVGGARMSPDGQWVLFSKRELNWEKNKRKTTWHMVSADGGDAFQFLRGEDVRSPVFSPDGKWLVYVRPVEKKAQLFMMRTAGGEGVQLSRHKGGVGSFKWSPDSSRVFFLADEQPDKKEEKKRKDGYDAIFVDEGPNGQQAGKWRNLWLIDISTQKEERVTEEDFRIGTFDVARDGRRIVFTARYENRRNQRNLSEIYLFDLEEKKKTRLTENRAPESNPQWAPNGQTIAYMAPDNQKWELRNGKIWVMDVASARERLASGSFDGNIRRFFWSPDGSRIIFGGLQKTDSSVFELHVGTGRVRQVTDRSGSVDLMDMSLDRTRMVYGFSDFHTPVDLFSNRMSGTAEVRLSDANPWIGEELRLGRGKVVDWKSRDGLPIEGLLFLPVDYQEGTPVPLILHIHGGPAGVFRNAFSGRYHVWSGLGYASLCPNVRGSSGYTDELLRGNMRDIGGGDFEDLMTGVDSLIEAGIVDPDRMGVRGWSYGGILGGWTITQTGRFKAASIGAMVSDWTSEYGPGFNHDVRLWYIGGTPWENPEGYRYRSALTHVADVTTPTLIIHGIRDTTDTEAQSMMFFAALKDQGKTVRYIRFPREPHGFREPRHQRTRDVEEIRWMQKHVLGQDWEPWERKDEKKSEEESKTDVTDVKERPRR